MGIGRIPGPYGTESRFGCVLNPGPIRLYGEFFGEFPHLTPGSMGTGNDLSAAVAESAKTTAKEDEEELKLLFQVYGSVKNTKGKSYSHWKKKKMEYNVADYVKDRDNFFGSTEGFQEYRDKARDELDANKEILRKYIEPPANVRNKVADWKKAQDVFYAWVRKAYDKLPGDKVDAPKLIKSQKSEKLTKALQKVIKDYGKDFHTEGFNFRPEKLGGGYLLGTISDHAVGNAIDIEPSKNAQIEAETWNSILSFTGKSLNHGTRQSKWKSAPQDLYNMIKAVNDEFVARLAKAMKETQEAANKVAAGPAATNEQKATAEAVKKDPLGATIERDSAIKKIGAKFLTEWRNGFFDLPWELVKELHEEEFVWGATFSNPDLHHFQL